MDSAKYRAKAKSRIGGNLITPQLVPFIRNLSQGKNLNGAMTTLELAATADEEDFIALMAKLRQTAAFTFISPR